MRRTSNSITEELTANFLTKKGKVRILGLQGNGSPTLLSEEDRENHMHILGAPGEGKSKFLELLIRGDIQRGLGACVLDPSENGDTVNKILNYCCRIGFEKVVHISPADFLEYNSVPVINPIKHKAPAAVSVGNMLDALKILWHTKDFADTPRIQRYATALLHALHASQSTLVESKYFLTRTFFQSEREKIIGSLPTGSLYHQHLTSSYQTLLTFEQFQSTVNRFSVFQDETLRLVLGSKSPSLPFSRMVAEGWLVLVNLDPQSVWGTEQIQQRLLGTLIINEITHAIHRLGNRGWRGNYYLYIDEVGDYATSKLAYILDKKRKTGLRFTLAHQRFEQIEDRNVLSAIRGSAKTKVLFFTPNNKDRLMMLQDMGYGGELQDREVLHILRALEKQQAAISVGKRAPRITSIADIKDIHNSPAVLKAYKKQLYSYEWFKTPKEINNEINARVTTNKSLRGKANTGGSRDESESAKSTTRTKTRTVPDNRPSSKTVLPHRKKRTALQSLSDKAKKRKDL